MSDFDAAAVEEGLDADYRVEFHESIGSTNDRARELARAGEAGVAVVAGEQTAGRGRRGREWAAPPGGAYVSVLVDPDLAPADAPLLTLAAGVATVRALDGAGVEAGLKWPNDVLVDGAKLAGILTERTADRVVVGVGINVAADPDDLPEGAASVRTLGGDPDRAGIVRRFLAAFDDCRSDPAGILPAWRERSVTLGRRVRVETPDGTVEGEAVDVEHPGTLVLSTADGRRRVTAGDCEHLRPA